MSRKQDDLVDVISAKLDDLKATVTDSQAQLRAETAALRANVDNFHAGISNLINAQVTAQLAAYMGAHAALHAQLDLERTKDTQRFWAVVSLLSALLVIAVGLITAKAYGTLGSTVITGGMVSGFVVFCVALKTKFATVLLAPLARMGIGRHKR